MPSSPAKLVHSTLPAVVFLVSLACSSVLAQQSPPVVKESVPSEIISFDFPGGTLVQYIEAVKRAAGELNVVVGEGADKVTMPPVALKRVTVDTAFKLVETSARSDEAARVDSIPIGAREGAATYVVNVRLSRKPSVMAPREPAETEKDFRVYPLKGVMSTQTAGPGAKPPLQVQSILTAIDTALGIQVKEGAEKPAIKFHEDTGLLLVHGTLNQVNIVDDVVEALLSEYHDEGRRPAASELREALKRLEGEIEKLKAELAELKKGAPKESK
ncbi:MAG: hypothetical protein HY721_11185 [Planctomycetes bacterium]|nr:hypothetical protein [Planctomycetota bacterium]